jgi:putative membrane protein
MAEVSKVLIILVALLHFYFMVLEMFLWTKPFGLKTFKQTKEQAQQSAVLAMNQGLYNGFLCAGLIWSLTQSDPVFAVQSKVFFLTCVVSAGILGGCTVSKKIFFIQAGPAIAAILTLLI